MADESLWPTRSVAEYAYCPRLFYYMAVEGLFLPSADTEEGDHVHRRVNHPSKIDVSSEPEGEDSDRPKVVRSLALTSASLKLTATLDLAEISGQVAIPVEPSENIAAVVSVFAIVAACLHIRRIGSRFARNCIADMVEEAQCASLAF